MENQSSSSKSSTPSHQQFLQQQQSLTSHHPKSSSWLNPLRFDIMGSQFKLKFSTSDTYKTRLGGFLSLSYYSALLVSFIIIMISYTNTTNPEVTIKTKSQNKPQKLDLVKHKFFTGLFLTVENKFIRSDKIAQYIHIVGRVERMGRIKANDNTFDLNPVKIISFVPCSSLTDLTFLDDYKNDKESLDLLDMYGICPNISEQTKDFWVESRLQSSRFTTYNVYIYPCIKTDQNGDFDCKNRDLLDNMTLRYNIPQVENDASNYSNPIKKIFNLGGRYSIDTYERTQNYVSLRLNEVQDNRWDFLGDILNHQFLDVDSFKVDTSFIDRPRINCNEETLFTEAKDGFYCYPYLSITYKSSPRTVIFHRNYKKILAALASFGGLSRVLAMVFSFLYTSYNKKRLKEHLRSQLFGDISSQENKDFLVDKSSQELERCERELSGETSIAETSESSEVKIQDHGNNCLLRPPCCKKNESERKKNPREALERRQMNLIVRLIDQNLKINQDGVMLLKSLNKLRVLEDILFEPHDKVLLPLIILKNMEEAIKTEKQQEHQQEKIEKEIEKKRTKKGVKRGSKEEGSHFETNSAEIRKILKKKEEMSVAQAYDKLVKSRPRTQLKRSIRQYILDRLKNDANFERQLHRRSVIHPELSRRSHSQRSISRHNNSQNKPKQGQEGVKLTETKKIKSKDLEKDSDLERRIQKIYSRLNNQNQLTSRGKETELKKLSFDEKSEKEESEILEEDDSREKDSNRTPLREDSQHDVQGSYVEEKVPREPSTNKGIVNAFSKRPD